MSSGGAGIGTTLTSGIQDIAAILPLLGTEQCSIQVSSALTRGYLYAAVTPVSIFGSLGVATAGFKTLIACFSFGDIEGANILGNMGFEPQGENLSLTMVEAGKGKKNAGRFIIETRMDELVTELNIDKNRITGVSYKSASWNVKMVATTALFCGFSINYSIHLFESGSEQSGQKHEVAIPSYACYWRLHHGDAHSTTHSTTNNNSFQSMHWLFVIISYTRQLKESDGCWMRNVASGLHVEWK